MLTMEVKYWTTTYTRNYIAEFIEAQPTKMQKKIFRDLDLVEKYGISFANMKKLQGYKMHEIKIKTCRIFCAIRKTVCWLLHAFIKKSNNTPLREIKTAFNRMKELDSYLTLNIA